MRTLLYADDISRALTRISHEIVEANKGTGDLILVGIPRRGTLLAHRIAATISRIEGVDVPVGSLDVTMYRDDLSRQPARAPQPTEMPVAGIDGVTVVLVDDVLYSGRTVRAALDALNDHGRPRAVRLAALIDRGHRELPIRADYIGKNLPSAKHERISLRLEELDGVDEVAIGSVDDPSLAQAPARVRATAPEATA
ncbi:bifunctional pyrimidine regulatory protein PyrR uracil phosphoribosyltransferase [Leucobacter sp. UCD-THU]|jgi:pyrimidine operon attenuation protein/uracil phosphoribosyltransferase|uniref:Bifunctional protein PyrR n=1 Tax=Leucobacter muris TaxID=1935379 RepID=A0ABX5QFA5_9MICO|nr:MULTISPECIES: bifunctional pyr operon transcriptional regulator/uracil phosphoribosyltransferase PyrR [Leucobacter]EYT52730.1 bifunctional pyrimidine regulatory protein PyrR uracil phosphoribosyltransferase [Leucobacter sp. UCD-THU]QAB17762.1 bifunctional pyr operon transcriptional regulator/uracil phosphoribosyltransferase PyrR [Leucobacter muris]